MKLKNETVQEIIDPTTGEVVLVTTSKTFSIKTSSEEFYMTFIKACSGLFELKSTTDLKLIIKMCCIAEFNTGKVYLPAETRKQICTELNVVNQQLSNSLKSLKEKNLIQGSKGLFYLNPSVFWKGTMETRNTFLREMKITVELN